MSLQNDLKDVSKIEQKRAYDKERYQKHKAQLHEQYMQTRGDIPPIKNKANRPSKYNKNPVLPDSNIKLISIEQPLHIHRGTRKRRNKDIPVATHAIYGDNAVAYANLMNDFKRNK